MKYAQVVFNISLDHVFSYKIPRELRGLVCEGSRVLASFGKRFLTGIVVNLKDEVDFDNCKELTDVIDKEPLLSKEILELTHWISQYYLSSWGQAIHIALPKGTEEFSKERIFLNQNFDFDSVQLTDRQNELKEIIFRQPGRTSKFYQEKFGRKSFYFILQKLKTLEIIIIEKKIEKPAVKSKERYFVKIPPDISTRLKLLKKVNDKIKIIIDYKDQEILFTDFLKITGLSASTINRLANDDILFKEKKVVKRIPEFQFSESKKIVDLTTEQKQALETINISIHENNFQVHLLHGVTGSGKTQIYLEAIRETYQMNKSAIILIPEISLTPQTVSRFHYYFKDKITVFHSKMSLGERYDAWWKIFKEEKSIVIGPRSALFMPVKNIGIIIVDEEHEGSYKQNDSAPRYQARDVAIYRAKMNNAVIILGSATPSLESYYNARKDKYNLIDVKNRIGNIPLPKVSIIDLRGRQKEKKESMIFTPVFIEKIREKLSKSEQIIILQNRRGYSSFQQCMDCGFIIRCPNCEVSLTYHSYNNKLLCHYCGYDRIAVETCPKCNGFQIKNSGTGTQKIELEIKKIIPGCKILRMDQDTTRGKNSHDNILDKFKRKEADILLGTQMIAKGLDFENVTLVGVISADIGLSLPDFKASERTFQLLTQVAGRSGRGGKGGEVIIQTYQFSHPAVQFSSNHDFVGFYLGEMKNRLELGYPPFSRIINIKIIGVDLNKTISTAREITQILRKKLKQICQILGPAPSPLMRIRNLYRWQILIKTKKEKDSRGDKVNLLLREALDPYLKKNRKDFKVQVDVDPVDLM